MDGLCLLPMFGRIVRADPVRAAATTTIALAKDYLFAWLTGQLATDPSTAAGYGWLADLLGGNLDATRLVELDAGPIPRGLPSGCPT